MDGQQYLAFGTAKHFLHGVSSCPYVVLLLDWCRWDSIPVNAALFALVFPFVSI